MKMYLVQIVQENLCVAEDRISISEVPADDISNQTVGKSDPANSIDTALGILPHEHSMESRVIKDEAKSTGPGKSKKKKELNLPRRVSKRLAGLPLDPTPQLKTTNRARRAAVKQSDDIVASTGSSSHPELDSKLDVKHAFDTFKNRKRSLDTSKIRHPIEKMAAPTEHVGKLETEERVDGKPEDAVVPPTKYLTGKENDGNEKHEHTVVSSSGYLAVREENIGKIETANVADEKLGLPIDLPLVELWQDPCIAFAIRTLTGISFNNTESVQASSGSNNSEFGGVATSEHARKDDGQDERECKGVLSLGNTTNPRELAGETENSDRGDEKPGSPLNLPFGGAWADPCIEFAIKTLTGAIPLDSDMVMQDCLLTKPSSSQSQDSYDLTLQNVCEPGQTNFLCQQFGISEKSLYNQGALTEPTLPHATNMNPGFSLHHQDSDKRSRNCQR
ncbi:hypothetical protein JCGZ_26131 [Jatropha curcas]|uniref:Uncharacterized protein n=1 Tax=Jatropha curcas TaxID=180498 RepID=A0A067JQM9_JATCU|nr:hypothetical protein JCGZ_26131 [Jatropha curcas]